MSLPTFSVAESACLWREPIAAPDRADPIVRELGLPPPLAALLVARGHADAAAADRFLNPRLSDLGDPFRLPQMDLAVSHVWRALEAGRRITVYGDYDVDGVTSTSLLLRVLRALGGQVEAFLPERESEGYGFTAAGYERCVRETRPDLLLTVDCGSTAVETVARARADGRDVIVTDHHEAGAEVAQPCAHLNPKCGGPEELRVLAGVGVAFKLCHALVKQAREQGRAVGGLDLRNLLDLVAVGTIADMVPLVGENRILARHGLQRLTEAPCAGLAALRTVAGARNRADAHEVGYLLGPRLNAAGRLRNAREAIDLLTTDDPAVATRLARELDATNRERQELERGIVEEAMAEAERDFDPARDFGLALGRAGWHVGVVGIVAARLARRFHRPAVVAGFDGARGRGSCRGTDGTNVLAALDACAAHLEAYGGHAQAAGITVTAEAFPAFAAAFREACRVQLEGRDARRVAHVDGWLRAADIGLDFLSQLDRLQPVGIGNPRPLWGLRGVRAMVPPRVMAGKHLRLELGLGASRWSAVGFQMAERALPEGALDILFHLRRNEFRGRTLCETELVDFRAAEDETMPAP